MTSRLSDIMARDARLIIGRAMDRLAERYKADNTAMIVVLDARAEIDYAFDLAQIPQTPGRKSKTAKAE
jgi:hypothetical protein